jgi:hypothetical protein
MVAGAMVVGPRVVPWVLGAGYVAAAERSWLFVLVGVIESIAYLVVFDRLASRDRNAVVIVWGAVVVMLCLALTVGRTPVALAWSVAVSGAVLCVAGVLLPRRATSAADH